MIRPQLCSDEVTAEIYSQLGHVALLLPETGEAALYGSPKISGDADGWAIWWAGLAGATFARIRDRGLDTQRVELTRDQAARIIPYCGESRVRVPIPTTVMRSDQSEGW